MIKKVYQLKRFDYGFFLNPGENGNIEMSVFDKPVDVDKGKMPPSILYDAITEAFEELPEEECKTLTFNKYVFNRKGSELDFYKEISKEITL